MVPAGSIQAGHGAWMLLGAILIAAGQIQGPANPTPLLIESILFISGAITIVLWPSLIPIIILTAYQAVALTFNLIQFVEPGLAKEIRVALMAHIFLRILGVVLMFEAIFRKLSEDEMVESTEVDDEEFPNKIEPAQAGTVRGTQELVRVGPPRGRLAGEPEKGHRRRRYVDEYDEDRLRRKSSKVGLVLGILAGVLVLIGGIIAIVLFATPRAEWNLPAGQMVMEKKAVGLNPAPPKGGRPKQPNRPPRKLDAPEIFHENPQFVFLDLSAKGNMALADDVKYKDNHLRDLPIGIRQMAGVPFRIQPKYLLLSDVKKIQDIVVQTPFRRLHVLHAAHFYAGKDKPIAHYVLHYENKEFRKLPVYYGRDVVNWWDVSPREDPPSSKVGWRGTNPYAASQRSGLRLFVSTYDNPQPELTVEGIDFIFAEGGAIPFCVAMTLEK
jgi:hypothetical protein